MSAKKYLKTVPPQPPAQPVVKTEKEEQLWNALKRHIMRERERKKQGLYLFKRGENYDFGLFKYCFW